MFPSNLTMAGSALADSLGLARFKRGQRCPPLVTVLTPPAKPAAAPAGKLADAGRAVMQRLHPATLVPAPLQAEAHLDSARAQCLRLHRRGGRRLSGSAERSADV